MGKRVLMIDGSARKRNTYGLLLQIGEILKEKGIETEILNLYDYEIGSCIGCEVCIGNDACAITDGMREIMQRVLDADGVVLSSPVYMGGVTAKFKAFADRTNTWVHKPETAGKPMMFVTTTMSTGVKDTKRFFNAFANGMGARRGDFVARAGKNLREPVKEAEVSRFLRLLAQDKAQYSPAPDEIVMFNVGKVLAGKSDGGDRRFWEDKGWMDMPYYYPCRLGAGKRLFSGFMFKVLTGAIK